MKNQETIEVEAREAAEKIRRDWAAFAEEFPYLDVDADRVEAAAREAAEIVREQAAYEAAISQ